MLWSSIKVLTNVEPKQQFYFLVFSQQSQVPCRHEHVHLLQGVDKYPLVVVLLKTIHVIQTDKTSCKEVTGAPHYQILSRQLMRWETAMKNLFKRSVVWLVRNSHAQELESERSIKHLLLVGWPSIWILTKKTLRKWT